MTAERPQRPQRPQRPLKVLITRAALDAAPLAQAVQQLGAQAVCVPAVCMELLAPSAQLEEALVQLPHTQAIAFASRYGVRALVGALRARGLPLEPGPQLFAVGPSTGAAVRDAFGRAAQVALPHTAEGLAQHIAHAVPRGARVLLPTALGAGALLEARLLQGGLHASLLPLYRTVQQNADADALTRAAAVDYIVFTSPSCVMSWVRWGRPSAHARLLTLGPSTSKAVRAAGAHVTGEAVPSSFAGLSALLKAELCPHP